MSKIEKRLRLMLAAAETVAAVKDICDRAGVLADEAASARNIPLLDEATELVHRCERKGGQMLLDGATGMRGIARKRWRRRARMDDENFLQALGRAQAWWRSRARPPAPEAVRTRDQQGLPASRTIVSGWFLDELGNRTRYVAGICARRYKLMKAAGGDPKKIEAELLAEVLLNSLENSNSSPNSRNAAPTDGAVARQRGVAS